MTLSGKRIVITRAAHQYADFAAMLIAVDAQPLSYPTIQIVPTENADLSAVDGCDWIIFTSANAVQVVAGRLVLPANTRIAAVGPVTADAVQRYFGVNADVIPPKADVAHLLAVLPVQAGERTLLPQSEIAPSDLGDGLRARGADVTVVPVYTGVTASGGVNLPALVASHAVHAITFTSGSTVEHFLNRYTNEGGHVSDLMEIPFACYGRSARDALNSAGFSAVISTETNGLTSLVTALKDYFHAQ